jgi:predicted O-methyltransferase YrrM
MTSREFFKFHAEDKKYDVIFIDAEHKADHVYKDVIDSMKHLNEGGFIILDDCNPPTKFHATPQYNCGPAWNGTVYQAFIQLKYELKDWSCFVVNGNWGLGILTNRKILKNEIIPFSIYNYVYENFDINRKELLQLISYNEFNKLVDNDNKDIILMRSEYNQRQGLIDLCSAFPENIIMAEIGSYAGESTELFLNSNKISHLYAIDPWKSGYDDTDKASFTDFEKVEKYFNKIVIGKPVTKLKMTFAEAFDLLPQLDVIYIDGSHQYEDVLNDIELALKKIKPGGIICGHDYHDYAPGVITAINLKLGLPENIFLDNSWIFHIK